MKTEAHDHVTAVTRYYRRNTKAFLRLGENEGLPAIHIALWPEGTESVTDALEVAHRLVLEAIEDRSGSVTAVADLGCGTGAGLRYLAQRLPEDVRLFGLTLGTLPEDLLGSSEDERIHIRECDFHQPDSLPSACTVAYCIEALAHSSDLPAFFEAAASNMEMGGSLIIMDDVVVTEGLPSAALRRYRKHWLVPGVVTMERLQQAAGLAGFSLQTQRDLTPWIRLGRPRDWFIRWTRPLWGWLWPFSDYVKSLLGGDARQQCLQNGETQFAFIAFRLDASKRTQAE